MSIRVKEVRGKYRLIDDRKGTIARRSDTKAPIDGGGHKKKAPALRQAGYLNDWIEEQNDR